MSERNEMDLNQKQDPSKERVGDILRKERITRRITVETIAKDLKLNVKYIKSLETSEYESLPSDPYIRVYLRSMAKYLSLDPEDILKKFYIERGLNPDQYSKDGSSKLHVSMKDKEEYKNPMLVVAIVLIALLAGFSFLANKKGWISTSYLTSADSKPVDIVDEEMVNDSLLDDSLFAGAPVQHADSLNSAMDTAGLMQLRIEATGDSVWAQIFSDGQSWKNVIYKDQLRNFTASDSFNIHIGDNSAANIFFNGQPVKLRGKGIVVFKLAAHSEKPVHWSLSKWNSVFRNRL